METRGTCNMCGKCCEAIHIPHSMEKVKRIASIGYSADAKFIAENWIPISREEAFTINPYLAAKAKEEHAGQLLNEGHYYTCTKLDKETKLCTVHEERPPICSGYPWYGKMPNIHEVLYDENCSYKVDIEDERARLKAELGEELV